MAERMVGGLSDPAPATPEVQEIANKVKGQLEQVTNTSYSIFQAISYSTQVVSGTNYVIKVQHGDAATDYVHLWVFQALPCYGGGLKLSRYQLGKTRDDPIP
ncbi:Leukocyte cysteine proteinase inhibitor 1 [Varanus komodoensis]|uniref:Cystatin domain-containing protein n=1 Tax=Varanus komodoensis TaxID=61221 RepID=A0A8D2LP95_VARKO|nr:leukocyte cysteine proteinase inhibitor 1-like isoform X1 [Varanus komodoensis]XP_044274568.1 leukocyte cysteine proteinase inhibitor 1-like isoform X1 [Varanus komodoensis]KAF7236627.1 Leukocyte cysteine proteinase inhibitor 1 [Varanus komodoensis]